MTFAAKCDFGDDPYCLVLETIKLIEEQHWIFKKNCLGNWQNQFFFNLVANWVKWKTVRRLGRLQSRKTQVTQPVTAKKGRNFGDSLRTIWSASGENRNLWGLSWIKSYVCTIFVVFKEGE